MRNVFLPLIFLSVFTINAQGATAVPIYTIQGTGATSSYVNQQVETTGIVTAVFNQPGKIGGFFIQDEGGDNNSSTSDGIFVSNTSTSVQAGDKVRVTGTVSENNGRTQLSSVTINEVISKNNALPVLEMIFPDDFSGIWENYEGMLIKFDQTLYVSSATNVLRYGELTLTSPRAFTPTNQYVYGSPEYMNLFIKNSYKILLDDASTQTNPSPNMYVDATGGFRTGQRTDGLLAVVDQQPDSKYVVYPAVMPAFYGNPRPTIPQSLGNYNVKVCGANLEYYIVQDWDGDFGPANATEFAKQRSKILDALFTIDADVYGLCEIQQGQAALSDIVSGLNVLAGSAKYAYINDGSTVNGTYIKVGYVYRKDRVQPVGSLSNLNYPTNSVLNRKKAQAFQLLSNGEKFIFSINHFKAKTSSSYVRPPDVNADYGEGTYNYYRTQEATALVSFLNTCKSTYDDEDILIMGDLNSYAKEQPVRTLIAAGYIDQLIRFQNDTAYSYSYNNLAGSLDHALASPSMSAQITGAAPFHINADELYAFEYGGFLYAPNMYRCSDHDPIVVGLSLGQHSSAKETVANRIKIYPNPAKNIVMVSDAENSQIEIIDLTGRKLLTVDATSNEQSINISSLPKGIYLLTLRNKQETRVERLIVE